MSFAAYGWIASPFALLDSLRSPPRLAQRCVNLCFVVIYWNSLKIPDRVSVVCFEYTQQAFLCAFVFALFPRGLQWFLDHVQSAT
jgi:hypothetical protein